MTQSVLQINCSPLGDHSISRKLTVKTLQKFIAIHPDTLVVNRDLAASPLPHLSGTTVSAFFTPPVLRNETLKEALKLSEELIEELFAADVIVISAPMWNFGIPSSLKAWIDHIVRAGRTFQYGAAGPESLLPPGKRVIIVSARGGVYTSGPMQIMDYQETYLKAILGFIGLRDISIIRAEGLAMGEEAIQIAIDSAESQLVEAIK